MGKKSRAKTEGRKTGSRKQLEQPKDRPWLVPVLVFLGALLVVALALIASAEK